MENKTYHVMSDNGLCEMFNTKEGAIEKASELTLKNEGEYIYVTEQVGNQEEEIIWSSEEENYEYYLYVRDEEHEEFKWYGDYYSYEDAYNEAESSEYRHCKIEDDNGNIMFTK